MLRSYRFLVSLPLLLACSAPGSGPNTNTSGGKTALGGNNSAGGSTNPGNGGTTPGAGGSAQSGGASAGGQSSNSGGSVNGGSQNGSGGNAGAGGASGGSMSGGQSSNGGNTNGGSTNGGQNSGGGSQGGAGGSQGGSANKGGTAGSASGGSNSGGASKGGTTSSGGTTSTGGKSASGGASGGATTGVYKPAFILGADVTITLEDEYWGANYTDAGQLKSVEQILKDHGFNFIRIDTFIDSGKAGGYAASMPEAFRDLDHTQKLAQRVKKIGMGFLLDLHYSQTWTNPGAQATPSAWSGQAIDALETSVYNYTKSALTQLKSNGAMPDMVQIGNEITNGMLWETGRNTSSFVNFARLLKAGIRAVRETDPAISVMLHIEKCNNTQTTKWFLDGVIGQGVSFDILGQSCYAPAYNTDGSVRHPGYQGSPSEWTSTFNAIASAYPNLKFVIAEYSSQQRAANDVMWNLPNKRGLGTFNWDPTRFYDTHPNVPLFSTNGAWNRYVAVPESMALYEQMAKDYGLR